MVLQGQLPVGCFDLSLVGPGGDPQHFVVVFGRQGIAFVASYKKAARREDGQL